MMPTEKLAKIHKKAKIHTIRKADITREQLGRRYAAMLPSNKTNSTLPINLLTVAKWYNGQDAVVQTALDKSEPLTWLKHLLDKEGRESTSRFPWHLTALIMEEYVRSKTRPETMETIPEDGVMEVINQTPPHVSSVGHGDNRSPSTSSWSYSVPGTSLEPSLSRRKPSHDGQVSFEPQVDSGRDSIGEDYRGSVDHGIRMRQDTYSPRSSINSSIFYGRVHGLSPNSSRLHFRDLASRLKRKPYPGSDDGLSSARNSISEQSQEEDPGYRSHSPRLKTPRRTNLMLSRSQPGSEDERKPFSAEPSESGDLGLSSGENGPMTARQPSYSIPSSPQPANSAVASPKPPSQTKRPIPRLARKRASLPSSPRHFFTREKEKQQRFADEAQERREYDRKNQLLEDLMLQNWRTRQILHKVGGNIKEYENVQKSLAASLGAEYTSIPQEVLDALNHDPCSVVSGTKRFKSWRAVEDIHGRIVRQRDTLRNFAQTTAGSGITTPTKSSFVDSIATLTDALQQLEVHRQHIVEKAETVAEALVRAKGVHATVKREYDETMGHTSLVYPELSQIITLEESYRNHYQQLWNIGLDALTLLLDTVTPFWRNYGKVIGQDIQDFLIIPWYRNEFTGEAKRYPIKSFPRRSFRHWIGLLICTVVAMLVTTLQIRAAWSCTLNYNLPWITHIGLRYMFIPLFNIGVLIQWTAVLVELAMVFAIFFVFVWWLGWAISLA
ncbi:hypothetical protein QCA50_002377 [Cerrena zonata]|uniref:Uncharacterized protein n=1 Tax=Cerrena zonata TaxID=2478898 RepID=A0AAW0GXW2_9APHY